MVKSIESQIEELSKRYGHGKNRCNLEYHTDSQHLSFWRVQDIAGFLEELKVIIPELDIRTVYAPGIDDKGLEALSQFTNITSIEMQESEVSSEGYRSFKKFVKLEKLHLDGSKNFDGAALEHLKNSAATLKDLDLSSTDLNDIGFRKVVKFGKLEKLSIDSTKVSDDGIIDVIPRLENLNKLTASKLKLTEKSGPCIYLFLKANPKRDIFFDYIGSNNWSLLISAQQFYNTGARNVWSAEIETQLEQAANNSKQELPKGIDVSEADRKLVREIAKKYEAVSEQAKVNVGFEDSYFGAAEEVDIVGFIKEFRAICPEIEFDKIMIDNITDERLDAVSKNFRDTKMLTIRKNTRLTNDGLKALEGFEELDYLNFSYNYQITSLSAVDLSKLQPSLRELNLAGTPIADQDVPNLSKLTGLTKFDIGGTNITDEGLKKLLPNLRSLKELDLYEAKSITEKSGAAIFALAELGILEEIKGYTLGSKWDELIRDQITFINKGSEQKKKMFAPEIAKVLAENPDMQRELDEARALLKAPSPNTGKGDAKSVVEQGKRK